LGEKHIELNKIPEIDILLDPNQLKKIYKVILSKIDLNEGAYVGIELEDYDVKNIRRYLYFEISSSGAGASPTSKIQVKEDISLEEVKNSLLKRKVLSFFRNYRDILEDVDSLFFSKLEKILRDNLEYIAEDLLKLFRQYGLYNKTLLYSFKIVVDNEYYLGEIDKFKKAFTRCASRKFSLIDKKKAYGISRCFICGEEKEVYGWGLSGAGLTFATPDKPGFFPAVVKQYAWKYQPICIDCILKIKQGWKIVNTRLSAQLPYSNINYIVIPESNYNELYAELVNYLSLGKAKNKDVQSILGYEDMIIEWAINKGDTISLTFMFTQRVQKKLLIHALVDNVYPSWLAKIKQASKDIIDSKNMTIQSALNYMGKFIKQEDKISLNWYLYVASLILKSNNSAKEYLRFIADILRARKPNQSYIIGKGLSKAINPFHSDPAKFKRYILSIFLLNAFIERLFNGFLKGDYVSIRANEGSVLDKINDFVKSMNIENPAYKAAFGFGVLIDYLFFLQRKVRNVNVGDEPFRKSLHSLHLDKYRIKTLFAKAYEKIIHYSKLYGYYNRELVESVAYLLKDAEQYLDSADKNMMTYYFALGLVFGYQITKPKEAKKNT
jgi:CRISPR-associated Csh1 family protein